MVNLLFGTRYTDLYYGYNALWRRCLPLLNVDCDGFEVETLINIRIARAGLVVAEVPSFERVRLHGVSNLNAYRDGKRVLRTIFRERFRPRRYTRLQPSMWGGSARSRGELSPDGGAAREHRPPEATFASRKGSP